MYKLFLGTHYINSDCCHHVVVDELELPTACWITRQHSTASRIQSGESDRARGAAGQAWEGGVTAEGSRTEARRCETSREECNRLPLTVRKRHLGRLCCGVRFSLRHRGHSLAEPRVCFLMSVKFTTRADACVRACTHAGSPGPRQS